MEPLNFYTLSEILEFQDISEEHVLELLIKEGLIDLDVYPFTTMEYSDDD